MNIKAQKTLKGLGIALLLIIAGILALAATKPDDYRYTRTANIAASPSKIFPQINNLQNWDAWSPWAEMDSAATTTFEGPKSGKGASMHWAGNNKVGEGTMSIAESHANKRVLYTLDFVKPMVGTASSEITLEPQPDKTTLVTWSMFGKQDYKAKVISVVMNCEKMMGKQFDKGLANLKAVVEPK